MDVTVTMSAGEFVEFLEYQKDHKRYEKQNDRLVAHMDVLTRRISDGIEPDPKRPGKYKIRDQEIVDDLWILAGNEVEDT